MEETLNILLIKSNRMMDIALSDVLPGCGETINFLSAPVGFNQEALLGFISVVDVVIVTNETDIEKYSEFFNEMIYVGDEYGHVDIRGCKHVRLYLHQTKEEWKSELEKALGV